MWERRDKFRFPHHPSFDRRERGKGGRGKRNESRRKKTLFGFLPVTFFIIILVFFWNCFDDLSISVSTLTLVPPAPSTQYDPARVPFPITRR